MKFRRKKVSCCVSTRSLQRTDLNPVYTRPFCFHFSVKYRECAISLRLPSLLETLQLLQRRRVSAISPDVLLPQVYRLLFLKPLRRHPDVVQLEGDALSLLSSAWKISDICSSANNPALYARAHARTHARARVWTGGHKKNSRAMRRAAPRARSLVLPPSRNFTTANVQMPRGQ